MKSVSTALKNIIHRGTPAYTYATVDIPHKIDGTTKRVVLTPDKFRVNSNSYTHGGSGFPIGQVLCKSITLSITNQRSEWDEYDWQRAVILLSSRLYPDGIQGTSYNILEGRFFASSVRYVSNAIEVTAYDAVSYTDIRFPLYTAITSGTQLYSTVWDFFVHLCDESLAGLLGITLGTNQHLYASQLKTDKFINSSFALDAITADSKDRTTLREQFGYIGQLAAGNVIIREINTFPYVQVDIVSYDLMDDTNYYNGMIFSDEVEDIYDGGEFDESVVDRYTSGTFEDTFNNTSYVMLDRYLNPPRLEYSDTVYSGIRMHYPVRSSSDDYYMDYKTSDDNLLELQNPLLQLAQNTTANQTRIQTALTNIYNQICNKPIRPFEGSFINNPLVEFGDNVIIVDANGMIYQSFVGEHTLHYLGESDISNDTPSTAQNNRFFN